VIGAAFEAQGVLVGEKIEFEFEVSAIGAGDAA